MALATALVGAGLELLSTLSADGSFAAAPAFVCVARHQLDRRHNNTLQRIYAELA